MTLNDALNKAKINRKNCTNQPSYSIIRTNVSYPALITNARLAKDLQSIIVEVTIWCNSQGIAKEYKFSLKEYANKYYQEFCENLEVEEYEDLIGIALWLHTESSQGYQNVKADSIMTMEELQDAINGQKKGSISNKKKRAFLQEFDDGFEQPEEPGDYDEDLGLEDLQEHIDTVKNGKAYKKKKTVTSSRGRKRKNPVHLEEDLDEEFEPEEVGDLEED